MKLATVTRNFAKCALAALMAVACRTEVLDQQAPETAGPVSSVVAQRATFELDDNLLDILEQPTKAAAREELLATLGVKDLKRVFPDAGEYEPRSRAMGLHRFYYATLDPERPVTKAAQEAVPGVLSVDVRRPIRKRSVTFNDPFFKKQWHLVNTVSSADIHVQEVWERYTTGDPSVIVSVVDESVDPTHPDINFWTDEQGHTGFNFVYDDWDLSIRPVYDQGENIGDMGHGTHVAGIIGAINNNGKMSSSMAGGDAAAGKEGVRIMSCAIFSGTEGADDPSTEAAIKWGADHGAVISQNSWGYYADDDGDDYVSAQEWRDFRGLEIPEVLKRAIDYFIAYAGCDAEGNQRPDSPMKGGLVFFAAGNEGHLRIENVKEKGVNYDPICAYEPVISVGAFDEHGKRAEYSNWGDWVDIAAPGGGYDRNAVGIYSSYPQVYNQKGVDEMIGTSMACPHVSGAAALLISHFGGPGFTADRCKELLFAGLGEEVGGSKPVGRRLNVLASFMAGAGISLSLDQSEVTVKAHESVTVGYQLSGAGDAGHSAVFIPSSDALSVDTALQTITVSGWKAAAGTYQTRFQVKLASGETHEASFQYTILPNHAPRCIATPDNQIIKSLQHAGTLNMDGYFTDEDGETLSYTAYSSETSVVTATVNGSTLTLYPAGYGISTVTVTAADFLGEKVSASFLVAVTNPKTPVSLSQEVVSTQAQVFVNAEKSTPVVLSLYSPAGALLMEETYTASVFAPISLDVSKLAPGRYTLQVAYDGQVYKVPLVKF